MSKNKQKSLSYIPIGPWYFQLRIKATIFCCLAIIILVYLGSWQMSKAVYKDGLLATMKQNVNGMPIRLSTIPNATLIRNRFTPVLIYGTYLNKFTFLLDNQVYKGQAGYRVLSAFQSPYLTKWVLIDRGWIAQGPSRQTLPVIHDIYGVQDIIGIVNTIPTGIVLQKDEYDANATWPLLIQALDFEFIAKHLNHEVYDFVVQLRAEDPTAYKIPPTDFGVPSDKHFMYALQWFGFAVLVFAYYLLTSITRSKN